MLITEEIRKEEKEGIWFNRKLSFSEHTVCSRELNKLTVNWIFVNDDKIIFTESTDEKASTLEHRKELEIILKSIKILTKYCPGIIVNGMINLFFVEDREEYIVEIDNNVMFVSKRSSKFLPKEIFKIDQINY